MTREQISKAVAALIVVLGIVAAADPELIPPLVGRYALLLGAAVNGVAGAFGFNVAAPAAKPATPASIPPRYQRHDQ